MTLWDITPRQESLLAHMCRKEREEIRAWIKESAAKGLPTSANEADVEALDDLLERLS